MIPYGRQWIDDEDVDAVVAALRSDFLTTGPQVEAFEKAFAEEVGARFAVAVSSATAGLHLCMQVLDVGPGDRVLTSGNTFLASANCAAMVGATPDFVDMHPSDANLDLEALKHVWREDVRAVVAVHYAGLPARMPEIAAFARANGAWVVEDASHAVGSRFVFEGREWSCGGHPWADLSVFSLHPVKTITSGEGGVITTDHEDWDRRLRQLRHHGMVRIPSLWQGLNTGDPSLDEQGPWYYEMQELGYNYRLTDLQCALGLSQLRKLPRFIERRQAIVEQYRGALADLPWLSLPPVSYWWGEGGRVSWHLFSVRMDFARLGLSRSQVVERLQQSGVGTQVLYMPVYLQPFYQKTYGYCAGKCPEVEAYYRESLALPLHPGMRETDLERVIQSVRMLADA
jgi:perosamine synthetase